MQITFVFFYYYPFWTTEIWGKTCWKILNFTFSKMGANARRAPNLKEIRKIFVFRATTHLRAHSWKISRARALHDARARASDHFLTVTVMALKVDGYCERMQLRNRSNKTKMPFFSVSFASLMWKKCRKTFCRYFHLWKFHC